MKTFSFTGSIYVPNVRQHSLESCVVRMAWSLSVSFVLSGTLASTAGDFTYTTNNGTIAITGHTEPVGAIVIPSTTNGYPVTKIVGAAFYQSDSLTSIIIPSSVTNIGSQAFAYCDGLVSVAIPSSITSVGNSAFYFCTCLSSVTIPSSVINIGSFAFSFCTSMTNIAVDALNSAYSSIDGVLFNKPQSTLIQCPGGKLDSYFISPIVTSIENNAFSFCTNMTNISVDALNSVYSSIDGVLFNKPQTTLIQCPGGKYGTYAIPFSVTNIGYKAFHACTKLTSVSIPSGVTSLGDHVFDYCPSLTNVTIPSSITSIGQYAFYYCTSLTSVAIPASVTNIGVAAFMICTSLTSVHFAGDAPSVGNSAFSSPYPTIYYLPGYAGWSNTVANCPTALWKPAMTGGTGFGIQSNQFGFSVTWASGMVVVVEASSSLMVTNWVPTQTNTFTSDTIHYSDPLWTNYPGRFYRVRML